MSDLFIDPADQYSMQQLTGLQRRMEINPEADAKMGGRLIFGFAVTEALGLIAAVVALALAFS